jgi:superfamily II DNA helicase RecQ
MRWALGSGANRYHAKLPLSERVSAHRAFQRDDVSVMVASLAFGMGIDKPNIRRIIHFVSAAEVPPAMG